MPKRRLKGALLVREQKSKPLNKQNLFFKDLTNQFVFKKNIFFIF